MSREHDNPTTNNKRADNYPVKLLVPYHWLRTDQKCDSDSEEYGLKVFSTEENAEECYGELETLPELRGSKDVFMFLDHPKRSKRSPRHTGIVNVLGMNTPCIGWMCFSLDCVEFEQVAQDQ